MESRDGIGSRGLKTKLIVNYLPQSMSDAEFRDLFASIGRLDSYRVMRDRQTNYCFGYGFVDYITPEDAATAIDQLNGYQIENKTLRVAYSKPPGSSKNVNLHVTGLAPTVDENKLTELFSVYGDVVSTKVIRDMGGNSKGAGFVLFREKPHADNAVKNLQDYADGYGTKLEIKYAKDAGDQQKNHPKYREFMKQNFDHYQQQPGHITHEVPSYMQHVQPHPQQYPHHQQYSQQPYPQQHHPGNGYSNYGAPPPYGTPYGTGQSADAQGPIRGRGQPQRFNPIARPASAGNASDQNAHTLFVYNVGSSPTESDIYGLFSRYGRIVKVDLTTKGYVFVHMPILTEAQEAIRNTNGMPYNGKSLQVSLKSK